MDTLCSTVLLDLLNAQGLHTLLPSTLHKTNGLTFALACDNSCFLTWGGSVLRDLSAGLVPDPDHDFRDLPLSARYGVFNQTFIVI